MKSKRVKILSVVFALFMTVPLMLPSANAFVAVVTCCPNEEEDCKFTKPDGTEVDMKDHEIKILEQGETCGDDLPSFF